LYDYIIYIYSIILAVLDVHYGTHITFSLKA